MDRRADANGPANAGDVARWWGERPGPAKRWIRRAPVVPVEVEGESGFVVRAEDADGLAAVPADGEHPGDDPASSWASCPLG